jgi:hypothetical protein
MAAANLIQHQPRLIYSPPLLKQLVAHCLSFVMEAFVAAVTL